MSKLTEDMETWRSVELRLVGMTEEDLTPPQKAALDAYQQTYETVYLAKWGEAGPRGASLRMETEAEATARRAWEASLMAEG